MQDDNAAPHWRPELGATIKLAAPLALAQLAQIAMGTTDTILLGSLGRDALAAGGLGANLFFTLMVVVAGGLTSVGILVSHARGSGDLPRIALTLRTGFLLAALAAAPPMLLLSQAEPVLLAMGQSPALAHAIGRYDGVLLFAMPASLIMGTQRAFLTAMGRPWMVMAVALAAVMVNGFLNYSLIHGAWGLPCMGYIGSCTATLITLWGMAGAIGLEMRATAALRRYRLIGPVDWRIARELVALGWPIAVIMGIEVLLFSGSAIVIGLFGETPLAAHQIALTAATTTFMVPLAIAQAANVRVGFHIGAQQPKAARMAGGVALLLGIGLMTLIALGLMTFPETIAGFYITAGDPDRGAVIRLAGQLLTIAALFQIFDGAQTIAAGALRGLKDTLIPAIAAAIGYWGIGFTTGWVLGVRMGMGAAGIWWGLAAGLVAVAVLLCWRFWILSGRVIAADHRPGASLR